MTVDEKLELYQIGVHNLSMHLMVLKNQDAVTVTDMIAFLTVVEHYILRMNAVRGEESR